MLTLTWPLRSLSVAAPLDIAPYRPIVCWANVLNVDTPPVMVENQLLYA